MATNVHDVPTISNYVHTNTAYPLTAGDALSSTGTAAFGSAWAPIDAAKAMLRKELAGAEFEHRVFKEKLKQEEKEAKMAEAKTRFVRVIIVDPNENLPLENRLIYSGTEKITDLTDQELFFELNIQQMLATHNERRVKVVNKKVKDRTEFLEPARIRDLCMVVTTIASF